MTLQSASDIRGFLKKYGLNPKKGLGQHFLCDPSIIQAIVQASSEANGILEIGPGPGILTNQFASDIQVVAIEIDQSLETCLAESAPKAQIVFADALDYDWGVALDQLVGSRYIVSNMPYYLSGALLQRVAEMASKIDGAVLMMQAEVADRVAASPGNRNRGSLTVYLESHFDIKTVIDVPPDSFLPPPNVSSRVLKFRSKLAPKGSPCFFAFVRKGFQQPRKTLVNNLSQGGPWSKLEVENYLVELGLNPTVRPHFLSLGEWVSLAQIMGSQ